MVSRGALRPVHPLGRLRRARRFSGRASRRCRMDHVSRQDSRGGLPGLRPAIHRREIQSPAWAQLAADAGIKYVVITRKHHDGFALFDSAFSDWNAVKARGQARPDPAAGRRVARRVCGSVSTTRNRRLEQSGGGKAAERRGMTRRRAISTNTSQDLAAQAANSWRGSTPTFCGGTPNTR